MNLDIKLAKITAWLLSRPKLTGFFVFMFLLLLIGLITNQRYKIVKENEHREMLSILNVVKQNIEQSLKNSYTAALTLALTIDDKGTPRNFEAVASQLISSNTKFKAVQLVPNGIIKYIYPLKGNEGALNSNVFISKKDNKYRAYSSVKNRKMYFLGPDKLLQGGVGIVGRLPVYMENKFWGFSAVVINLNTFLSDVGVLNVKDKRFYFQFSKFNITSGKEEFYLPGNTDFTNKNYETAIFPDGNWRLYIISSDSDNSTIQILYPLLLGLFLALICAVLVTKLLKKPAELQRLVDLQAVRLLETEVKFKTIFDEAAIGIAVVNSRNGNFLQVNKKLCEILGYSEHELNDLSLQSITYPDDIESEIDKINNLRLGLITEFRMQTRYMHKEGHIKWANIVETPLWNEDEQPKSNILIIEDITDRKAADDLVNEQNKRLLNFSYIVSHNLRSHASNIQAITNLLEITESEAERKEMVDLLKTVSGSLNDAMLNLNKVVNIQTSIDISTEPLNLSVFIRKTLDILNDQVVLKKAVIKNNVPDNIMVNYNPAYLESILLNFIFNAIRYSHPDRIPEIELSTVIDGGQIVLQVEDNGIGIDLDKHGDQLFGMYKTFNGNPDSKGVGLFISKNQIDAMGGKVLVESAPDIGTKFMIYFK